MTSWFSPAGFSLRYRLEGAGDTTLLLVHEMGGTLETWDEVAAALAGSLRVLRYDLRGAGLSQKIRGVAPFDDLVADAAALVAHVAPRGRILVCGCAVGAAVALAYAARHPRRVDAAIALSPATGVVPSRRAEALAQADEREREGFGNSVDARLDRTFPPALRGDPERLATFRARMLSNDPGSYAALHRMLIGLDLAADLAAVACPVLVLAGSLDQARPPDAVREVAAAIPGARFKVLQTGHVMPALTPELVVREIATFLADLPAGRPPAGGYLPR